MYGRPAAPFGGEMSWFVRLSTGLSFGAERRWARTGQEDDLFLVADVTGDGRADLVFVTRDLGAIVCASTGFSFFPCRTTRLATLGTDFSPAYVLVGDVTGDGRADLVTGSVRFGSPVEWRVYPARGCSVFAGCFTGIATLWTADGAEGGDYFRLYRCPRPVEPRTGRLSPPPGCRITPDRSARFTSRPSSLRMSRRTR